MIKTSDQEIRVFFDADGLFAGAASPNEYSASLVLLRMAEITLIKAITNQQVIIEVQRNLAAKIPRALPAFDLIINRCITIVENPDNANLEKFRGLADDKDLPILVSAIQNECGILTTYNIKHYNPVNNGVKVMKPGDLILRIRHLLNDLP